MRELNDELLALGGCRWDQLSRFDLNRIDKAISAAQRERLESISRPQQAQSPAVFKDTRFCLLLPLWQKAAPTPYSILVHRHPVAVARSLNRKNGLPLHVGIALWELYMVSALNASRRAPRSLVYFESLAEDPIGSAAALHRELAAAGLRGLNEPQRSALKQYFNRDLISHGAGGAEILRYLSASQQDLYQAAVDRSILELREELEVSDESREVLAEHEAQRRLFEDSQAIKRAEFESLRSEVQTAREASKKLRTDIDNSLHAAAEAKRENRQLNLEIRIQGAELKSTTARCQLQEDKLKVAAHWLERASEQYALLTKTRRWRILSAAARLRRLLTGRESEFDRRVREMKELESALRGLLPQIGSPVRPQHTRAIEIEAGKKRAAG